MSNRSLARLAPLMFLFALAALALGDVAPAQGASFTVNAAHDAVDASPGDGVCADAGGACTLRAAVMETNALAGEDVIGLPAGTYTLSIPGADEDASATGDLDVTDALMLGGEGSGTTVIDGGGLDRVIHVSNETRPPARLITLNVSVRNGIAHTGAGVFNDFGGYLEMHNSVVSGNTAESPTGFAWGGGIANFGIAALANGVLVSNNFAAFEGGGIYNALTSEGLLIITDSVVAENTVTWHGGGIFNSDRLVIWRTSILNNTAGNNGGGIGMTGGQLELQASLVAGNTALNGGGIYSNGSITAWNDTFSGNSAETGGGIYNASPGTLAVANVTVSANAADTGADLFNAGFASPVNTIIARNDRGGDCSGPINSRGNNIDYDGTCNVDGSNLDPLIAPLADNGGRTQTHALIQGGCPSDACIVPSPAIDAANLAACPSTDQRGEPRPFDGNGDGIGECDIGAYEVQEPPLTCTGPCGPVPTSSPTTPASPTPAPTSSPALPVTLPTTGGDVGSPRAIPIAVASVAAIVAASVVWRVRRWRR